MPELNVGGAELVISTLMNNVDNGYFDVRFILISNYSKLIKNFNKNIIIYKLKHSSVSRGIYPLLQKIYRLRPDIVFSGMGHLNISIAPFIPLFRLLSPKIYWVARQTSILSLNNKKEKSPRLYEWLYKKVYKNYDKIICQSNYMQSDLIDNYQFPIEKSVVINNPVEIDKINLLSYKSLESPFESKRFNILSVGQLRPEKAQEDMLKALYHLDSNYTLTLIGEGDEKSSLQYLTDKLGIENRVHFIGYQSNPYSYMREADLLILSSEYEGFPNVVLEAGVCGLPVVSYKCAGGVAEIIEDGINGFLVEDRDVESLAEGIKKAKNHLFDSTQIRDIIKKKYNKNLIIDRYQQILKEGKNYE
jgi:glycosyltransferase involved in cell wall biosynthesis